MLLFIDIQYLGAHPSLAKGVAEQAHIPLALVHPRKYLRLVEKSEPVLPGHDWVRVRPLLSGICGSDLSALTGHVSPSLGAFTSTPYVPGHEVVGWREDDETRVVVQPALGCRARGVEPPCPECAEGLPALCRNTMKGDVSAGLQIGYCRETSGGWGEVLVAHRSQLHPVPDALDPFLIGTE